MMLLLTFIPLTVSDICSELITPPKFHHAVASYNYYGVPPLAQPPRDNPPLMSLRFPTLERPPMDRALHGSLSHIPPLMFLSTPRHDEYQKLGRNQFVTTVCSSSEAKTSGNAGHEANTINN